MNINPRAHTLNVDSNKPVHIAPNDPKFGGEGLKIVQLWYPETPPTGMPPTLPEGAAFTKKGVVIPTEDTHEFVAAILYVLFDLDENDVNSIADAIQALYGHEFRATQIFRRIAQSGEDAFYDHPESTHGDFDDPYVPPTSDAIAEAREKLRALGISID